MKSLHCLGVVLVALLLVSPIFAENTSYLSLVSTNVQKSDLAFFGRVIEIDGHNEAYAHACAITFQVQDKTRILKGSTENLNKIVVYSTSGHCWGLKKGENYLILVATFGPTLLLWDLYQESDLSMNMISDIKQLIH